MANTKIKSAVFCNNPGLTGVGEVYAGNRLDKLAEMTQLYPEIITENNFDQHIEGLKDIEVIFSTWGMLPLSSSRLDFLPNLKALFYAASATEGFVHPFLRRNIIVCSAWRVNAIPVAEFTTAQILLSLKGYFRNSRSYNECAAYEKRETLMGPGIFRGKVALVGDGAISTLTAEYLARHDVDVTTIPTREENMAASLKEAFETAFVVSNHLPHRADNVGVLNGRLFASMPLGAAFVNTARGGQVNESEMIEVLRKRPDLTALLDVTCPEPPDNDSELFALPNVVLSSHVAGSINNEIPRMADCMFEEFHRYERGEILLNRVDESMFA